ncbi:hypothetical protein PsorP6_017605 [Peronosclerospora sorghi]|uniref:Uncharacterized protein n=1 Tax=Peronosclerospora sorghi TaxID=230839 RepID=A0ACC0WN06_9STRA|nr:hypothetical protein PsorP6_017605 [Peronosclerospora sorghi]
MAPQVEQVLNFGKLEDKAKNSDMKKHPPSQLLRQPENQHIFDEVVDRGDESFRSDQWKEGVTWVQAAKAIPDTDVVVKSEEEAESLKRAVDKEELVK